VISGAQRSVRSHLTASNDLKFDVDLDLEEEIQVAQIANDQTVLDTQRVFNLHLEQTVNKVDELFKTEKNINMFENVIGTMQEQIEAEQKKSNQAIDQVLHQNKEIEELKSEISYL